MGCISVNIEVFPDMWIKEKLLAKQHTHIFQLVEMGKTVNIKENKINNT